MTGRREQIFHQPVSELVWRSRYRHGDEADIRETWRRVAHAVAMAEGGGAGVWSERFLRILEDFRFLPGGRILAGAGTSKRVTLLNCFVMGVIEDSMDGIFQALKEGALTMQHGGGVGYDFSTLRPAGLPAEASGSVASGPVSFMHIWDTMCATLVSTGARRGAMMATLHCDHPDVSDFIHAKARGDCLTHFNLSVLVTDRFMAAVAADETWELAFPRHGTTTAAVADTVSVSVPARALWGELVRSAYDTAEPGVLFIDRINAENNLWYRESLSCTNPCGEIPLPAYGACDLGSVNLTAFVRQPFSTRARLDTEALAETVRVAVRFLDNVITVSRFPLEQQHLEAMQTRRVGLGVTGLADALAMLGFRYDSAAAREFAAATMRGIRDAAYLASIALAREKGSFPAFEPQSYLESAFIRRLPAALRDALARDGIRNSHLLAIAPTGTISLLANNVSSGIEPIFAAQAQRRIRAEDGVTRELEVSDYALSLAQASGNERQAEQVLVEARSIAPLDHLEMQAALQPYVDSAISKTINVATDCDYDSFSTIYRQAHALGLKGCTTFRAGTPRGEVLRQPGELVAPLAGTHCCTLEREVD